MPFVKYLLVSTIPVLALAACGGGGGSEEPVLGACVVSYAEPVFIINAVTDAVTGAPITDVTLANVTVNGVAPFLTALTSVAVNVQTDGRTVQCKVACAFATNEGDYVMTVTAPGYRPETVSFSAAYATFERGCPARYSGGSKQVSVRLTPA